VQHDFQASQNDLGVRAVELARRLHDVLVAQRGAEGHTQPAEVPTNSGLTHGAREATGQADTSAELNPRSLGTRIGSAPGKRSKT